MSPSGHPPEREEPVGTGALTVQPSGVASGLAPAWHRLALVGGLPHRQGKTPTHTSEKNAPSSENRPNYVNAGRLLLRGGFGISASGEGQVGKRGARVRPASPFP